MSNRLIQYLHNLPDDEFKSRYLRKGFFSDVRMTYEQRMEIDSYVEQRASKMIIKPNTEESNGELPQGNK
jgi:hypothetical protein